MEKNNTTQQMLQDLKDATFGVNTQTLADHLKPETIEKVAEFLVNGGWIKQSWIDADERLPDSNGRYWATDGKEVYLLYFCHTYNAAYDATGFNVGKFTYCDMYGDRVPTRKHITHWMPYDPPAPPMLPREEAGV